MARIEKERIRQERLQQEEMEREARFQELQRRKQEEREKALADAKAKKDAALAAKKEKELEARRQKKLEKDAAAAAAKVGWEKEGCCCWFTCYLSLSIYPLTTDHLTSCLTTHYPLTPTPHPSDHLNIILIGCERSGETSAA